MNALAPDVVTIGNHEVDYGIYRYKHDLKKYPQRLILGSETCLLYTSRCV